MKNTLTNDLTFGKIEINAGLKAIAKKNPADIIKMVEDSGLRGRGGAGFTTSMKWKFAANAKGKQKYVVCNADEGEPGTFKDRDILRFNPHALVEGMVIAGYSIAFSNGGSLNAFWGGLDNAFLAKMGKDTLNGSIPDSVFMTFQMTFAIITPALIVGAFAERMKFSAMLWFMAVWLTVVYAPICHWVWEIGRAHV